jgi:hypothetical protein
VVKAATTKSRGMTEVAASLGAIYTSFATESNNVLPFLTLKDFEAFGKSIVEISQATLVTYTPYLANEAYRREWEDHAAMHADWVSRGHASHTPTNATQELFAPITPVIWHLDDNSTTTAPTKVEDTLGAPYMPLWQMSPPPNETTLLQLNLYRFEEFSKLVDSVRTQSHTTLSPPFPVNEWLGSSEESELGPQAILMHPVYSGFEASRAFFAATVWAVLPFKFMFTDVRAEKHLLLILHPASSRGIHSPSLHHAPLLSAL